MNEIFDMWTNPFEDSDQLLLDYDELLRCLNQINSTIENIENMASVNSSQDKIMVGDVLQQYSCQLTKYHTWLTKIQNKLCNILSDHEVTKLHNICNELIRAIIQIGMCLEK
jgi:hypothetical protein